MTTKVTIDAHAGWPVRVEIIDQYPGDKEPSIRVEVVPALTERVFYIHSNRHLRVTEMPLEA